jgi:Fur family ferric uptake transcriptional regulator
MMEAEKPRRNTRQRRIILEELRSLSSHPTAAELYEIARRRLPKLSLGTVYRNLELLSRMGIIRRLDVSGGEARFDGNLELHYHVRCVHCGQVDDIYGLPTDPLKNGIKSVSGFEILGHRLDLIGICPECKMRTRSGNWCESG